MTIDNHFKKNAGKCVIIGALTIITGFSESALNIPEVPQEIQRVYQIERELKLNFQNLNLKDLEEEYFKITSSPEYKITKFQHQRANEDYCKSFCGGLSLCFLGLIPFSFGSVYLFDKKFNGKK